MRVARAGEVWEWCTWDDNNGVTWEPVLLLERLRPAVSIQGSDIEGLHTWLALDLLSGEVAEVYNVPRFGWEKVE